MRSGLIVPHFNRDRAICDTDAEGRAVRKQFAIDLRRDRGVDEYFDVAPLNPGAAAIVGNEQTAQETWEMPVGENFPD